MLVVENRPAEDTITDDENSSRTPGAKMMTAMTTPDMELALPARAANIAVVRHAFGALGEAFAVDEQILSNIRLAVTEACTNVVVHAYPDGDEGPLEVLATLQEEKLEVVVRDEGPGIGPRPGSPVSLPAEWR